MCFCLLPSATSVTQISVVRARCPICQFPSNDSIYHLPSDASNVKMTHILIIFLWKLYVVCMVQSQKSTTMVSWSVRLFVLAVCFTRTVCSQSSTCPQISSIPFQSSFDFDRFAGELKWNVLLYNKIVPIEGLDMPVNKSDLSFLFSRNSNNTQTVTIGKCFSPLQNGSSLGWKSAKRSAANQNT